MLEHDCHLSPEDGCEVCDEIFNSQLTKLSASFILTEKEDKQKEIIMVKQLKVKDFAVYKVWCNLFRIEARFPGEKARYIFPGIYKSAKAASKDIKRFVGTICVSE